MALFKKTMGRKYLKMFSGSLTYVRAVSLFHTESRRLCSQTGSKDSTHEQQITILGKSYTSDRYTNVTPQLISKIGRELHNTKDHPLNRIFKRIESFFYKTYTKRGNPIFSSLSSLSPVVTLEQNFDNLLVPENHVSRKLSDSYYINSEYMLRAHTSAHQSDLIRAGLDAFIVCGDVFRRDAIDSTHFPIFHQMEGVKLFSDHELFKNVKDSSGVAIFEKGTRNELKQETHTLETSKMIEHDLKACLETLMKVLFGNDVQMRWVPAYFPFTHPSWELEILMAGEWVEMLGCGVMEQAILDRAGASNKAGWAFGLGLERLAMKLFTIPDIRLFWSTDSGFLHQFEGRDLNENITYKAFSKFAPVINDISFWIPENFTPNDFYDLVRTVGGDVIEQVSQFDEFTHPKKKRTSHAYRIVYRHMERVLTQEEVNDIHFKIARTAEAELGIDVRDK